MAAKGMGIENLNQPLAVRLSSDLPVHLGSRIAISRVVSNSSKRGSTRELLNELLVIVARTNPNYATETGAITMLACLSPN